MTLKDDLIAAKALIDTPKKWCKRELVNGDGKYCAIGACMFATQDNERSSVEALRKHLPYGNSIVDFNDASATTHFDIMALFDRAIEAAA